MTAFGGTSEDDQSAAQFSIAGPSCRSPCCIILAAFKRALGKEGGKPTSAAAHTEYNMANFCRYYSHPRSRFLHILFG